MKSDLFMCHKRSTNFLDALVVASASSLNCELLSSAELSKPAAYSTRIVVYSPSRNGSEERERGSLT